MIVQTVYTAAMQNTFWRYLLAMIRSKTEKILSKKDGNCISGQHQSHLIFEASCNCFSNLYKTSPNDRRVVLKILST